jgi:hypothetical protein
LILISDEVGVPQDNESKEEYRLRGEQVVREKICKILGKH